MEHLAVVDSIVQLLSLVEIDLVDSFHAAEFLIPLESLKSRVDGQYRRSIEHSVLVDVGLVVEHCRDSAVNLTQSVFLNDNESNACRSEVLLSTAIDDRIFAYINRARENVARHIGYHRHVDIGVVVDLSTIDGVVGGDVEIIAVGSNSVTLRDIVVVIGFRRTHYIYFTKQLGFLNSLVSPCAGVEIRCLLIEQVIRNHAELEACATTEE